MKENKNKIDEKIKKVSLSNNLKTIGHARIIIKHL